MSSGVANLAASGAPTTAATADPRPPLGLLEYLDLAEGKTVREKRESAFAAALLADRLGYRRLWLPEHHALGTPSTNPAQLAAVLGSHTSQIRIGTAVTLVRVRDPYQAAEDLVTAGFFCGERLDVGFGRGDVIGPCAEALDHLRKDDVGTDAAIGTVISLLDSGCEWIDPLETPYQRWMHGSGTRSAALAGRAGFYYCHALFFNPDVDACTRTLDAYRAAFPAGRNAVAIGVVANDDPRRAKEDSLRFGLRINCVGSAEQCADAIHRLRAMTGADEVIITEQSSDPEDHRRALTDIFAAVADGPRVKRRRADR
ncbi:LLM class flavin-dependent oxidoreductase [Saccharopolyspora spinosa]|uniref:Alkanesulfonate monooxygenase SsuD/methylene tetrahydromethanopterin reductase-like flavin-dependent oxidoreductase (Luciferase family) n=1 Tax=Saccharopolyspora spinosa TaxID=60894 RepID=A0A2N3XZJ7_SACSN|nr:LLM class flavin-dependent oxidoreductase [Saccharopolyspora spinosa]PKW16098.1 alkanesulfonate monooxygenase SsuD/methylene tetrahydromethanopterin reductase-like flavin-dependent oxidoreductase (luciferase family) [Saccharopolyspora spinosa]